MVNKPDRKYIPGQLAYYTIYAYLVLTLTNLFKGGIGLCGVGGVSPGGALVSGSPGLVGLVGGVAGGGKPLQGSAFLVLLVSCSSYSFIISTIKKGRWISPRLFLHVQQYPHPRRSSATEYEKAPSNEEAHCADLVLLVEDYSQSDKNQDGNSNDACANTPVSATAAKAGAAAKTCSIS